MVGEHGSRRYSSIHYVLLAVCFWFACFYNMVGETYVSMKSLGHKSVGGNFNLHGKRTALCTCGCCMMINPKQKLRKKEDRREMRSALRGS